MLKQLGRFFLSIFTCLLGALILSYIAFIIMDWNPRWEKINLDFDSPDQVLELFNDLDLKGCYSNETKIEECNYSDTEFQWFKFPPRNSVFCFKAINLYMEASCSLTYLRDEDGVGWIYKDATYAYSGDGLLFLFSIFLLWIVGLIAGIVIGIIWIVRVKRKNQREEIALEQAAQNG